MSEPEGQPDRPRKPAGPKLMLIPFMILVFFRVYIARRASSDIGGFFSIGRMRTRCTR